jgi:hypothetical protein
VNPLLTTYVLNSPGSRSLPRVSQALASAERFDLRHFDGGNNLWISLFDQPKAICILAIDPDTSYAKQWVALIRDTAELNGVAIVLACPGEQFLGLKAEVACLRDCHLVPDDLNAKDLALAVELITLRHYIRHTERSRNQSDPSEYPEHSSFTPSRFMGASSSAYTQTMPVALSH